MSISKIQPFLLGLIGNPVEHSRSPQIFSRFFSSEGYLHGQYSLFPLDHINAVTSLIHSHPYLIGFNVTIPFKSDIIPLLTHISPQAKAIGAVNTVKIERIDNQTQLYGHNTDYFGFEGSLNLLPQKPKQAIIIGTGGSSKAVSAVLTAHEIPFIYVSRSMGLTLPDQHFTETLLVNCTPVGMWPNINASPLHSLRKFDSSCSLIDLVYNPEQTLIMQECEKNGIFAMNGKLMLEIQAEKAWHIFKY
jgi:shikimate dehydrogenase